MINNLNNFQTKCPQLVTAVAGFSETTSEHTWSGLLFMKKCNKCCEEKPLSEFSPDKKTFDRLKGDCKKCRADYTRRSRRRQSGLPEDLILPHNTYKHGLTGHRLYKLWSDVKNRCYNHRNTDYHRYGGRGITMYEPWINDPVMFIDYIKTLPGWDNPELSIDRIENDGNYEPDNLRFATAKEQANNRRNNKK